VTITPESTMQPSDKTPYNESRALKKHLTGVRVTASTYPAGREVPVDYVNPDMELRNAAYPGIYLSYAGMSKASDREVRGKTNLQYAPIGYPDDVQVPADFEDKDSVLTEEWNETFDRLTSPYTVEDHPIPYNLDFNVTVVTRNYAQQFEIIAQLDEIERIPARFGGLEVPEDGTVRTLDLLGGPETSVIRDEDGKRLVQSIYTVRVAAELSLYEVQQVQRVINVVTDVEAFDPSYL
jgi:hypothetical protein